MTIDYLDLAKRAFSAKEAEIHNQAWDRYEAQNSRVAEIGEAAYMAEHSGFFGCKGISGHPGLHGVPENLDQILREAAATLPIAIDLIKSDNDLTVKEAVDAAWYARGPGVDEAVAVEYPASPWAPKGSSIVRRVIAEIVEILPYAVSLSKAA